MEIRRWQIYVVINFVIVTHLVAKPVSLNELIAAESKQKRVKQHTKPTAVKTVSLNELIAEESIQEKSQDTKLSGSTTKPLSPKTLYSAESRQKFEKTRFTKTLGKKARRKSFSLKDLFASESTPAKRRIESLLSRAPGTGLFSRRRSLLPVLSRKPFESAESIFSFSPLKARKKFEIKSPLKPKKIKYSLTPRLKRKNESTKREVNENEIFDHKYIPLIKRIGLLMGDILSPDSNESHEPIITKRKRRRNNPKLSHTTDRSQVGKDLESSESEPQKTSVTVPTTVSTEITTNTEDPTSETPDTTTYTTPAGDFNTLRPDPDISLPLARNTSSDRGDNHGISERSGSSLHTDDEGYISRNNRSDEYNSRGRRNQTYPSSNEENPCSSTRINTSSDGPGGRTRYRNDCKAKETETCDNRIIRRNDTETKNIFQMGREQETLQVPRNVRRLPGHVSDKVLIVNAESVPTQESSEKSFFSVTNHHTSAERGSERNGSAAAQDQRIRQVIEGVIPIHDLFSPNFIKQRGQQNQVVTIFDGYSVARDINGRNKLTEKSIRISPD